MADNDYNTIQPIESLASVLGVAPTEQQSQQQRRKGAQKGREPQHPPKASGDQTPAETPKEEQDRNHLIDYRA